MFISHGQGLRKQQHFSLLLITNKKDNNMKAWKHEIKEKQTASKKKFKITSKLEK